MQEKAVCPECEIRALQASVTKESIASSVAKMARVQGVTTGDAEYSRRLSVCESCPSLKGEILCAECGSYVAYRARILNATCPFPGQDKWKASPGQEP